MIRPCTSGECDEIRAVINDAAEAYRNVVAADCWHDPYMSREEVGRELDESVRFWGFFEGDLLVAVMGLQLVGDVALVRHAYTRPASQGRGMGSALLAHLRQRTDRPVLVGTWKAAAWAVGFYQHHGFRLVDDRRKDVLLRRYWTVPGRQIEESVVLADERWFAANGPAR
jgi:GNAT superfamily N-acetyltransferase